MDHTCLALLQLFDEDVHVARVRSLANAVAGVLNASVASIAAIGRAYARLAGIESKSGVKQVDRLLSNKGVALEALMPLWIRHVVGTTSRIALALDWTDFDGDDHTTLCAYLVTTHGRAMPLAWQTVKKSTLTFRDTKDITFGMGLRATHIRSAERRDRMLFLIALAHTLLTLLGAASEASGLDRTLKTNTSPKRTMSLFNQGLCWYQSLPNMREEWLERLLGAYEAILREHTFLCEIFRFEPPVELQK